MSHLIIGLTGGIASGKTTVANLLGHYGIDIIDADIVARDVVAPGSSALAQISQHFGPDILSPDGSLNRSELRQLIFSDAEHKTWLNNLLHPLIRQQIATELSLATSPYCLLVAPLLIENNMQSMVDLILVVDSNEQDQLARTMARDHSSEQQVKAIIAAQVSRDQRLIEANDIIHNNGSIEHLTQDVKKIHDKYQQLVYDRIENKK